MKFSEDDFFRWTGNHFYRTSYNDMRSKVSSAGYLTSQSPVEKKNAAVPGYKGFVPGMKNNNHVGKRYTEQTRDVMRPDVIDNKKRVLATTGFNFAKVPKQDETLQATSHRHGKSSIMDTHPSMKPENYMVTSMRASFESPKKQVNPVWRNRSSSNNLDSDLQVRQNSHRSNNSGFTMNSTLFDGTGWVPEKNLHGDQFRTLYRN